MSEAPESDEAVMAEPAWQETMKASILEAPRPGAQGWTDDSMAVLGACDFALENVRTSVVWWHGRHDANAPLQAVERVTHRLPEVDLRVWADAGHLEPYHREEEILRDLLVR